MKDICTVLSAILMPLCYVQLKSTHEKEVEEFDRQHQREIM